MKIRPPDGVKKISRRLIAHDFQAFLVGGAVRDALLGREVKDYDLATDASPADVLRLFPRVIPTGLKHGTVTILEGGGQYEVTTFRLEGEYQDRRRPESVTWTSDIVEDLGRRDFTINAMAYDFSTNELLDPFGGKADLDRKIIRAIGDAEERLREDALRILRAVRIASQLEFSIEPATYKALEANAGLLTRISSERVRDEFNKILETGEPSSGLAVLGRLGLIALLLPELEACRGVAQPALHCFDVFTHSLYSCDGAPADNREVRLAALFHDIGKPPTRSANQRDEPCFYSHEKTGALMARDILTRLRYPGRVVDKVTHLIRCHMWMYEETWTDAAVRRFVRRVGREHLHDLFLLRRADQYGMCRRPIDPLPLIEFERRIDALLAAAHALSLKDLAVNGDDLMRELRLSEGEAVGVILDFLLESVLDDPALNERERLLTLARRFREERLP
ncbi:MAG: HD domain-containing protein [Spirochaetales bacterium]|nr:HD domain-containing protein [Spirochaetales bacterium]